MTEYATCVSLCNCEIVVTVQGGSYDVSVVITLLSCV